LHQSKIGGEVNLSRFGQPSTVVEAIEKTRDMADIAEGFIDDVYSDLENLISDMERYNDGDDKDTILDGIRNFINEVSNILVKLK
jgi:hypothetical protein